jgi:transposase
VFRCVHTASAPPHEATLIEETVEACFALGKPGRLAANRPLIAPTRWTASCRVRRVHRDERAAPKEQEEAEDQDGRELRRYEKRWKLECLFAWLGNLRGSVLGYEQRAQNLLGFVHLGCIVIPLRHL